MQEQPQDFVQPMLEKDPVLRRIRGDRGKVPPDTPIILFGKNLVQIRHIDSAEHLNVLIKHPGVPSERVHEGKSAEELVALFHGHSQC